MLAYIGELQNKNIRIAKSIKYIIPKYSDYFCLKKSLTKITVTCY